MKSSCNVKTMSPMAEMSTVGIGILNFVSATGPVEKEFN